MQLYGKTALITGAAKRIGREIALYLAKSGASIVIHYNQSRREAEALKRQIEALRRQAWVIQADFGNSSGPLEPIIKQFVKSVYQKAKKVDVLVNNASVFYPTPFGKIKENDWDHILSANLKAPFFLSQEIGKKMQAAKSGKIINLVDWTAKRPHPDYLPYAISKAGLMAATTGLAKALSPYVQVNSIAPGPILPPAGSNVKNNAKVIEKTLLKRFGAPSDIAQAVLFFVEGSDFVTGSYLAVDGGAGSI